MSKQLVNALMEAAEHLCSEVEFTMRLLDPTANWRRLSANVVQCIKAVKAIKEGSERMNEQYEYCIQVKRYRPERWVVERMPYQTLGNAEAAIENSWLLQSEAKRNGLRIMRRKIGEWEQVEQVEQ